MVGLDLHAHEAFAEHSDGSSVRVPLTPDRPVAEVTRGLLGAVRGLGTPIEINPKPQEVAWTVPLDEDDEHATYDAGAGRGLLRRRRAGRARARRVPGALPRPLHPGQRLVGLLRPLGQPLLRAPGRPALGRLHHAQLDGRPGGRRRLVARRPPPRRRRVLRLRPPRARRLRRRGPRPGGPLGRRPRPVHARVGRRRRAPTTRTPPRSSSPAPPSSTPASSATGTRASPPPPRETRPRSRDGYGRVRNWPRNERAAAVSTR